MQDRLAKPLPSLRRRGHLIASARSNPRPSVFAPVDARLLLDGLLHAVPTYVKRLFVVAPWWKPGKTLRKIGLLYLSYIDKSSRLQRPPQQVEIKEIPMIVSLRDNNMNASQSGMESAWSGLRKRPLHSWQCTFP